MNRVILVESKTKAVLLQNLLKEDTVLASVGHIKRINLKSGVQKFDSSFAINWEFIPGRKSLLNKIDLEKVKEIIIATDPDREGERIAFDLLEYFIEKQSNLQIYRVKFNSMHKQEILKSLKEQRGQVDFNLAKSAQVRSALDYYIGYKLSALL
jgi:DNA topoisomerase-1